MRALLRNWQVLLLLACLAGSLFALVFVGVQFGLDFKGGTFFQVQLDEAPSQDKMSGIIVPIISQRVDAFGLKDTKVSALGSDLVAVEIAETDPKQIERIETLLKTQGKFEATLDGAALIGGSDIVQIFKDPARGYGVHNTVDSAGKPTFGWQLPFILNQKAAEKFSRGVFHRCTATSFDPVKGSAYDCDSTFFFIDRPQGALLVLPDSVYGADTQALIAGNELRNIPANTSIDLLLQNADVNLMLLDENLSFTQEQLSELKGFSGTSKKAVVHSAVPQEARESLVSMGFKVVEANTQDKAVPWIWSAVGARTVISITAGIANLDPYVDDAKDAQIFSELLITGGSQTADEAKGELKNLEVLLVTGSLPIGIRSISKESVSPLLGKEFLWNTMLIGLVALLLVALVVFLRYRHLNLAVPIVMTGVSEIIIIIGVSSLLRVNLDLASMTGILAAIGTGVDHQIIIMDELLKGGKQGEEVGAGTSFSSRIQRAFFIIIAAAAIAMATMLPLFLGVGAGKLKGFAIMTILGVIIGVGITRPAFSVFAEYLLRHEKKAQ